jgi:hypothetical protein
MDVNKTLQELYEERRRLDLAIAALEARRDALAKIALTPRRERKPMTEEQRQARSIRMSKYWEARRAAQATGEPTPDSTDVDPASA